MKGIMIILFWLLFTCAAMAQQYTELSIEATMQGKIFYIAGKEFIAVNTCYGVKKGDIIVFQGNPYNCFQISFYDRNIADFCTVYCKQGGR